jgi:hypothetical protein
MSFSPVVSRSKNIKVSFAFHGFFKRAIVQGRIRVILCMGSSGLLWMSKVKSLKAVRPSVREQKVWFELAIGSENCRQKLNLAVNSGRRLLGRKETAGDDTHHTCRTAG